MTRKHVPKDQVGFVVPADIVIRLDDGNTIELRRLAMDGLVTVGINLLDRVCSQEAAGELDSKEIDALIAGLKALSGR